MEKLSDPIKQNKILFVILSFLFFITIIIIDKFSILYEEPAYYIGLSPIHIAPFVNISLPDYFQLGRAPEYLYYIFIALIGLLLSYILMQLISNALISQEYISKKKLFLLVAFFLITLSLFMKLAVVYYSITMIFALMLGWIILFLFRRVSKGKLENN